MRQGPAVEVRTEGTHAKHALAGALELATGSLQHALAPDQTKARFRAWLQTLADASPATQSQRIYVVVDHSKIH